MEVQTVARKRLKDLRESRNISQEDLSAAMGISNRQSLSELEAGNRAIKPDELLAAARFFNVAHSYFTDPLELAGEAKFSWRKSASCEAATIENFENTAGKWIALYRHLGRLNQAAVNSSLTQIDINTHSSTDDAYREGSAIAHALGLGDIPAQKLANVLTEKLDILILHLDITANISGAACKLGPLNTIMINRREVAARRNFDLAHEFFHLLTWHSMPPEHVEESEFRGKKPKVEQLADAFAAGLLIPEDCLLKYIQQVGLAEKGNTQWIKDAASHFKVSGSAMKWRLKSMGYLTQLQAERIEDAEIRSVIREETPLLFSKQFVDRIHWALENGTMSVRKVANHLQMPIDELQSVFLSYELAPPFDL